MSEEKKSVPALGNFGTGPFVYFDSAPTFGVLSGAVQVELAARVIEPGEEGRTNIRFVAVGHLRCSPAAAVELRNAIDQALKMLEPDNAGSAPTGATVN